MGDDYARALEGVQELETIRAVFASGSPKGLGHIRNGVMAGILAEVIAGRHRENAEEKHNPVLFGHVHEVEGLSRSELAVLRFRLAFEEVHAALTEHLDVTPEHQATADLLARTVLSTVEALLRGLGESRQAATDPGNLPGRGDMARRDRSGG